MISCVSLSDLQFGELGIADVFDDGTKCLAFRFITHETVGYSNWTALLYGKIRKLEYKAAKVFCYPQETMYSANCLRLTNWRLDFEPDLLVRTYEPKSGSLVITERGPEVVIRFHDLPRAPQLVDLSTGATRKFDYGEKHWVSDRWSIRVLPADQYAAFRFDQSDPE